MDKLAQATMFRETTKPIQLPTPSERETTAYIAEDRIKQVAALDSVSWASHRFITSTEIGDVIAQVRAAARAQNTHIADSAIINKIGSVVALPDRAAHLEALSHFTSSDMPGYEIPPAIMRRVAEWDDFFVCSRIGLKPTFFK